MAAPLEQSLSAPGNHRSDHQQIHEKREEETPQSSVTHAGGWKLGILIAAIMLGGFLVALDETIIATAIPQITNHFQSLGDIGWYGSAYFLTSCATQLSYGQLYKLFPLKVVFLLAVVIFEVGSLIAGVAPTSTSLIIGRAISGLGCAGVQAGVVSIVAVAVPLPKRSIVYGFSGAVYGVSSVVAPLLGGAFTTKLTWRWCFFINIPCGALTFLVVLLFFWMPRSSGGQSQDSIRLISKVASLDFLGMLLFVPSIVCLLLALQFGGSTYPWSSGRIIALWVVFGLLFVSFLLAEWRRPLKAMLPFRLLTNLNIVSCAAYNFCMGGAASVMEYYIPIYLQAVKGFSALDSGLRTIPMILGFVVFGILGGFGTSYVGYCRPFMVAGGALMGIGAGVMTMLTLESSPALYLGLQVIIGAGGGLGGQQAFTAIGADTPDDDIPLASSIIIFSQMVGSTVFLTAAQNIFTGILAQKLRAASIDSSAISSVGVTDLKTETPADELLVILRAYSEPITRVYTVAVALGVLATIAAFGVKWQSVKSKATSNDNKREEERPGISEISITPRQPSAGVD